MQCGFGTEDLGRRVEGAKRRDVLVEEHRVVGPEVAEPRGPHDVLRQFDGDPGPLGRLTRGNAITTTLDQRAGQGGKSARRHRSHQVVGRRAPRREVPQRGEAIRGVGRVRVIQPELGPFALVDVHAVATIS